MPIAGQSQTTTAVRTVPPTLFQPRRDRFRLFRHRQMKSQRNAPDGEWRKRRIIGRILWRVELFRSVLSVPFRCFRSRNTTRNEPSAKNSEEPLFTSLLYCLLLHVLPISTLEHSPCPLRREDKRQTTNGLSTAFSTSPIFLSTSPPLNFSTSQLPLTHASARASPC